MGRPEDETLAKFFAAADTLFAKAPWNTSHDSHVLAVEAPEFGWPKGACVAIVGSVGDHPSLMVFPSLEQYVRFMEQADEADVTGDPPVAECAVFSVNFDPRREAPKDAVKRAKALGLRAADPQGFPWLERFAPRNLALETEDEDYGFATALMESVSSLLSAHPGLFQREDLPEPLLGEGTFEAEGKRHTVVVIAPHPEAPWQWDESALEYFRWSAVDELRDEYLQSVEPAATGDCGDADPVAEAIEDFFAFKIFGQGLDPLDFAHDDVEEYLLRHLPEYGDVPEAEVPQVPERLAALLRWLGEQGRIDPELAALLVADTERCRAGYLARMKDPTEAPSDAPPQKKWAWTPGEAVPDPKGDCPCGSGRRYKKCCMPR